MKTRIFVNLITACLLLSAIFTSQGQVFANGVLCVDVGYTGGSEDGSQEHPYSNLGYAVDQAIGGTKVCVAQGTYEHSDETLHMLNKDGIVLEGGYESTGWTRDIEAYPTVIDGTGLEGNTIGIYNVSDVTVDGFTITGAERGQWAYSGIDVWQASSVVIKNCKIIDNVNSGIQISDNSSVTILNSLIENNERKGIGCYRGNSVTIERCRIRKNLASGIHIDNSSATIFNNLIEDNLGGVSFYGGDASASIINNTILTPQSAIGIYYYAPMEGIEVKNNVIIGTYIGIYGSTSVPADITHNNVYGHASADYLGCGTDAGQDSTISVDPLFAASGSGDYHLQPNSPCVDAGDDSVVQPGDTDFDGKARIMGTHVDLSCFERDASALCPPILTADLDGTGKDEIIIDFGSPYGIWILWNDGTWEQLHALSGESMIPINAGGTTLLAIDFGPNYGIWMRYPDSSWEQLHVLSPEDGIAADINGDNYDEVILDFGEYGIWIYYPLTDTWTKLHNLSPESIAKVDANGAILLAIDFGDPYGIWIYDGTWEQLHNLSPEDGIAADINGDGYDEGILNFGEYGIWMYYPLTDTWTQLHTLSPESMVAGNLDASGEADIIIDFGVHGIWTRYNDSTWQKLHTASPDWMTTGDMDGNGQDEVIIDFGEAYGIWARRNDSTWEQIHSLSP